MDGIEWNLGTFDISRTIDAVWKIESPKLIAALARMTRDVGLAEDLAQDALVSALEQWPEDGIPRNPGAWLMAIAKRRGIDHFRRNKLVDHSTSKSATRCRRARKTPRPTSTPRWMTMWAMTCCG